MCVAESTIILIAGFHMIIATVRTRLIALVLYAAFLLYIYIAFCVTFSL